MSVIRESVVNQGHNVLHASLFAVHSTANPGATAANHRDLWSRGYPYAVHLVSDWNEALHCVPYDRLCWQVGNGNATCEGLEICEALNASDFARGIDLAASVVAERLTAHGWGVDRVHPHQWFSRVYGGSDHTDAIPYFARFGYTWDQFIARVSQVMGAREASPSTITEETHMAELLIVADDEHAGLKRGQVAYWNNLRGLQILGNMDQAHLYEAAGVKTIHSSSKAAWATMAAQLTQK